MEYHVRRQGSKLGPLQDECIGPLTAAQDPWPSVGTAAVRMLNSDTLESTLLWNYLRHAVSPRDSRVTMVPLRHEHMVSGPARARLTRAIEQVLSGKRRLALPVTATMSKFVSDKDGLTISYDAPDDYSAALLSLMFAVASRRLRTCRHPGCGKFFIPKRSSAICEAHHVIQRLGWGLGEGPNGEGLQQNWLRFQNRIAQQQKRDPTRWPKLKRQEVLRYFRERLEAVRLGELPLDQWWHEVDQRTMLRGRVTETQSKSTEPSHGVHPNS